VEFGRCMGGVWLERNMSEMLNHMFSLASNPRASVFHVDAVYARKCVMFMLRSLIGGLLGERAQIAAAKEICVVIVKQMNTLGITFHDCFLMSVIGSLLARMLPHVDLQGYSMCPVHFLA